MTGLRITGSFTLHTLTGCLLPARHGGGRGEERDLRHASCCWWSSDTREGSGSGHTGFQDESEGRQSGDECVPRVSIKNPGPRRAEEVFTKKAVFLPELQRKACLTGRQGITGKQAQRNSNLVITTIVANTYRTLSLSTALTLDT